MKRIADIRNSIGNGTPKRAVIRASANPEVPGNLLLEVYGDIGESFWGEGITAQQVADALKGDYASITARINSPGGSAFEGVAIYNVLKASGLPVKVIVDGLAASAASLIAMAGDVIEMGKGTMLMIHPAQTIAYGDSLEMRHMADVLEKASGSMADIYAARSGQDRTKVVEMMYAETWMSADEAVKQGFATAVTEEKSRADEVAAQFDLAVFAKVPDTLLHPVTEMPKGTPVADIAARTLLLRSLRGK